MCVRVCVCYSRTFFDILLAAAAASGINHCSWLFLIAMLDYDMSSSLLSSLPHFLSECVPKYSRVLKICRPFCKFLLPLHVELFIM